MTPGFCFAAFENKVVLQFSRLELMDQWWHWLVLMAIVGLVIAYVAYWYRRDWTELPRPLGIALLALRLTALLGVLIFFLDLQKRTEQQLVRPSRLAVLIDTSLSMDLPPDESVRSAGSRSDEVIAMLSDTKVVEQFTRFHDTTFYRFDQSSRPTPIASFSKPRAASTSDVSIIDGLNKTWRVGSTVCWVGSVIVGVAIGLFLLAIGMRLIAPGPSLAMGYVVLAGVVSLIFGIVIVGVAMLQSAELPLASLWNSVPPDFQQIASGNRANEADDQTSIDQATLAWRELIQPNGTESRIGDGIQSILEQERAAPLAGVLVITDGQNNAGTSPSDAVSVAQLNGVPIYAIGLGSAASPRNVRMVDVEAPKRVFPGDNFRVTALLQSSGLEGQTATIQLRRMSATDREASFAIEQERAFELQADETIQPIRFEVTPDTLGEWVYEVRVIPPESDTNSTDNEFETQVRVVEPRTTVLLMASGPTREYQFVRNMLYRDESVQSHVYLQTGGEGISQESQKLLKEFPTTLSELLEYDVILAFDADWMELTTEQASLVEQWVAGQAGGLILVAGPVATPRWTGTEGNGDARATVFRSLCPAILNSRGTRLVSMGRFESETSYPLDVTPDGIRTEFMQVATGTEEVPSEIRSMDVWQEFSGVYSFFACYDAKPAATILSYFSDPSMTVDGKLPIYQAAQFFGAGRVVFQGGGEIWRMRELSVDYFDQFYIKLVRWAGQGRLLRDSDRGQLLLDREQTFVGEQVVVRAVLRDEQFQPLLASQVECQILEPDDRRKSLSLLPIQDPSQPGVYVGQFLTKQTGNYTVQLPIGGLANQEVVSQQVTVRLPAKEIQRPQRNDVVLEEITSKTGGRYFLGIEQAIEPTALSQSKWAEVIKNTSDEESTDEAATGEFVASVVAAVPPVDQTTFFPGTPDREFQFRLMSILLALIAGSLTMEWLFRRICRLA